jgi:dTDP-4-dehydrorhamnose reductase
MVAGLVRVGAPFGTYHAANSGACSWFEFAEEVVRLSRTNARLERLAARDTDKRVRRPLYSALGSEKLADLGLSSRPWQDGLSSYLQAIGRIGDG